MSGKFTYYDLGNRQRGETAEVTLSGNAAHVRLLDSSNFSSFRNGRRHNFIGGLAEKSPVRLRVPRTGHWYVTVDLQGLGGSVRSGVRVIPAPLPTIREQPLSSVPSLIREVDDVPANGLETDSHTFDVFISHASEDKEEIVRPLAEALQMGGLDVWYDEFELKIGDSLRRKIDYGLAHSRFGLVILSEAFFSKNWTNYELDGLVTRSVTGEQVLLPVWHKITKQQLVSYSPTLADKVARSSATHTVDEIASEIIDLIEDSREFGG